MSQKYPVIQEIVKADYGAGKGNLEDKNRIGSVHPNLGMAKGMLNVEVVRIAQEKIGKRTRTSDEVRWDLERVPPDPAKVENLGAEGRAILVAEQNASIALAYALREVAPERAVPAHEEDAATLRARDGVKAFCLDRTHADSSCQGSLK